MSPTPAVSVLLPVYNGENYVGEAVESILAQSFEDFELIVINDGSTDNSGKILHEMAIRDLRIVLIEKTNGGLVSALNDGIKRARAPLIARMDADDVSAPERLEMQFERMKSDPTLGVLGSFIRIVDQQSRPIRIGRYPVTPNEVKRFLEHGCPLAHPTVMMKKEAVLSVGGYREAVKHAEDYDLWLRISEAGYHIANVPRPLLDYRSHAASISVVHRDEQNFATVWAQLAHRARTAGLSDPVGDREKIDEKMLDSLPEDLSESLRVASFLIRYGKFSIDDWPDLKAAWAEYRKLPRGARQDMLLSGFVMRALHSAVQTRRFGMAFIVLMESCRTHPMETLRRLFSRLIAKVTVATKFFNSSR